MFTGIVQKLAEVRRIDRASNLVTIELDLTGSVAGLVRGASVAVNGVCLTVSAINGSLISFDVIPETLGATNLNRLTLGGVVNVERSYRVGDEIGGHIVSGHVGSTAVLVSLKREDHDQVLTFEIQPMWMKYIFHKGFIAVDGASLTVSSIDRIRNAFSVSLIPETLERPTLGGINKADLVNIEVESQSVSVVDTVERILSERRKLPFQ